MNDIQTTTNSPAFAGDAVAICLAANDFYVPFLSCALQSIKDTSSAGHNYDIWVLTTDITAANQKKLQKQVSCPNISLRFVDVSPYADKFQHLFVRGHFRVETYYRLLMQDLFPGYAKMVYLDCDLIVRRDLYQLYSTNVTGCLLAAVRDVDTAGLYNGAYDGTGYSKKEYMDEVLRIKEPYLYFQAGVILFNLDEFRANFEVGDIILYALSDDFQLLDQDVLNFLAQGKTAFLDYRWNVVTDWKFVRIKEIISLAPPEMKRDYLASREDPWIIHYAGPDKPWDFPRSDMGRVFWDVCFRTPYCGEALRRLVKGRRKQRWSR